MMGACAYLIPAAGIRFIKESKAGSYKEGAYDLKATIAINIFGLIGVFVAAYVIKSLPLTILKWLVVGVVLYASTSMFRSFFSKKSVDQNFIAAG